MLQPHLSENSPPSAAEAENEIDLNFEVVRMLWCPSDALRGSAESAPESRIYCVPVGKEFNPRTRESEILWSLWRHDGSELPGTRPQPLSDTVLAATRHVATTSRPVHPWDAPAWTDTLLEQEANDELAQFVDGWAQAVDHIEAEAMPEPGGHLGFLMWLTDGYVRSFVRNRTDTDWLRQYGRNAVRMADAIDQHRTEEAGT